MSKADNAGLVRAYIEKVSGSLLEDQYRPIIASMIRGHAGVYALYKGDQLYYVGLAINLMGRVKQHLRDRHARRWDRFSVYLTSDGDHIKPLESLLLRIVRPSGNRVSGRMPGAKDDKRALHKAMQDYDSMRHANLLGGNVARRQLRKKTSQSTGSLVLGGLVDRRIILRADYKGERFFATLRKDGYISYAGTKHPSPTSAAFEVVGRNVNGWKFWHYRKSTKGWVPLAEMRR